MLSIILLLVCLAGLFTAYHLQGKRGVFIPFTLVKTFNPANTIVYSKPSVDDLINTIMDNEYPLSIRQAIKKEVINEV